MTRTTALALAILLAAPALARAQELAPNPKIIIDYVEPMDPARLDYDINDPKLSASDKVKLRKIQQNYERLVGVREELMKARLLERFSMFLSALKLPTTLRLVAKQCDMLNAFYSPSETSITLCYEYVAAFQARAPKETTAQGISREDAIVGSIISTMLHETGHALFSIYRVPILGREEDAADQAAGFVMLQFGTDIARTTIKGTAWKWGSQDWTDPAYHDVHSTPQQRFYNYLCIAYGGNPQAFQQFIDIGWLPKWRVPLCAAEYQQVAGAFAKTILPHIDEEILKKVQATTWIQSGEFVAPKR